MALFGAGLLTAPRPGAIHKFCLRVVYVRMALRENLIGISFSGRNAAPTYDYNNTPRGSIQMKPLPGFTETTLPGGRAWRKEREYRQNGIPISAAAKESLERLAQEGKLVVPW